MNWLVACARKSDPLDRYLAWVASAGVVPLPCEPADGVPAGLASRDALLLLGGADVNPARYGEPPHPATCGVSDERDRHEFDLVRAFLAAGRPVYGICRGIQSLNVALGGALIQHVPDHLAAGCAPPEEHRAVDGRGATHGLRLVPGARLAAALRAVTSVNSWHHQAVDPGRLGRGLRVAALSPGGIVEMIESEDPAARVIAVQWHPERLPAAHPGSRDLLDLLVRTAAQKALRGK